MMHRHARSVFHVSVFAVVTLMAGGEVSAACYYSVPMSHFYGSYFSCKDYPGEIAGFAWQWNDPIGANTGTEETAARGTALRPSRPTGVSPVSRDVPCLQTSGCSAF